MNQPEMWSIEQLMADLNAGARGAELEKLSLQILKAGYYQRAATFWKADPAKILNLAQQELAPEIHRIASALWTAGFRGPFMEWSLLLARSGRFLPSNVLPSCMDHAIRDLNWAVSLIPVMGPLGKMLAGLFEEWKILDSEAWKDPLQFVKKEQREFAIGMLRDVQPKEAIQVLRQSWSGLKEAQKLVFLRKMKRQLNKEEWSELGSIVGSKSALLHLEWLKLGLGLRGEYAEEQQQRFEKYTAGGKFDGFSFSSPLPVGFDQTNAQVFQMLPTWFISEKEGFSSFFKFLNQHELDVFFLEAMGSWPDSSLAAAFFEYEWSREILSENYPVEKLFGAMDHATFNACCLKWLDMNDDQIDLEAFLHAVQPDKHFWSDALCQRILELRERKAVLNKYDLDVFWQLLPFKINPVSNLIPKIPEECRFFMNTDIHFENVLRFRKWMRR